MRKLHFHGKFGQGLEILVDDDVYEWASKHKWYWKKGNYAVRAKKENGKCRYYFLHKQILGIEKDPTRIGDHRNGNQLDCRRENLRITDRKGNSQNRRVLDGRRFKGVAFVPDVPSYHEWMARIRVDGKLICLGYFGSPEAAAQAYNEAAVAHFGEFARLNEV